LNVEVEKDYSSGEENEYDLIETEAVEVNPFDSKDNDYLLVGIYGNGSAFLKSSIFLEMKNKSNSYKLKFMTKMGKDKTRAKNVSYEIFQFSHNSVKNLVLHTKQNFTDQSYKYLLDYLKNNGITYKRVAIFDSTHVSSIIGLEQEVSNVYCLKNTIQMRSNQLIRVRDLPSPNTVHNFAAYLMTYHEVIDLPCVVYLSVSSLYDVSLQTVKLYNDTTISYAFLRDKLTDTYLTQNQISNLSIFTNTLFLFIPTIIPLTSILSISYSKSLYNFVTM
jgi:hypothetical protein